jgi:cellulose biosynthesis protein BcsQ
LRVLASYNIKGGVGKTAAAVNLAHLAAESGFRTLIWDLDPQGAASFYFRIKPKIKGGGGKLLKRRDLDRHVKGTDFPNLDLLPADFSYRHLDIALNEYKKPTRRLRKLLGRQAADYDYVFIDCAPSISLVSEGVFLATDVLLIPTIPTILSLHTLKQIDKFFRKHRLEDVTLLPFYSMVDWRKGLHRRIVNESTGDGRMLATSIPYATEVERMGLRRAPLTSYASNSRAGEAFRALWTEIQTRVESPVPPIPGSEDRP